MSEMTMDWLLRPPEDTPFEYPEDDGSDWIDEALKKGYGFKSEVGSFSLLRSLREGTHDLCAFFFDVLRQRNRHILIHSAIHVNIRYGH